MTSGLENQGGDDGRVANRTSTPTAQDAGGSMRKRQEVNTNRKELETNVGIKISIDHISITSDECRHMKEELKVTK